VLGSARTPTRPALDAPRPSGTAPSHASG